MDKRDALLKRKANAQHREVDLDGITVTVRGLTRAEVKECSGTKNAKSTADLDKVDRNVTELRMIATALIDPVMSYEDVCLWINGDPDDPEDDGAPAGDSTRVMTAVAELSGLDEGASKRDLQNVRSGGRRRK